MSRILNRTPALRTGPLGATTISVAAHAGLIALAVASATGTSRESRGLQDSHSEHVQYAVVAHFESPKVAESGRASTAPKVARSAAAPRAVTRAPRLDPLVLDIHVADVDLTSVVPDLNLTVASPESITFGDGGEASRPLRSLFGDDDTAPVSGGTYTADLVDRQVESRPGNPKPKYPPRLRDASVADAFYVRYVVDSSGIVEKNSVEFPASTNRLFAESVTDALYHSRYFPAEIRGRRVRQIVEQHFTFRIER